jgi:signal transduction histidine kinase
VPHGAAGTAQPSRRRSPDVRGCLRVGRRAAVPAQHRPLQLDREPLGGDGPRIRNPLTGIRTTIQFVETKLPKASPLKQDLDDAIKELDRIEQFTTDLLQFARPKISELQEANINDIVEKVLTHVAKRAEEQGVQIKSELGEDLPPIALDQDAVQQALLNIVINALDVMPEGGLLRVSSSSRRYRSRRAVEVAVADTGTGIPEEVIEKMYDPFFTTRGSGGTGLGLSIALQIVKEHGGRIHVRNRPQGGAIFRLSFRLPDENEGTGS